MKKTIKEQEFFQKYLMEREEERTNLCKECFNISDIEKTYYVLETRGLGEGDDEIFYDLEFSVICDEKDRYYVFSTGSVSQNVYERYLAQLDAYLREKYLITEIRFLYIQELSKNDSN